MARNFMTLAFVVLAGVAVSVWRRRSSDEGRWLAAAFCALAATLLANRLVPDDAAVPPLLDNLLVVPILAFPYLLHRFAAAFELPAAWVSRIIAALTVTVVATSFLVLPRADGPRSPWFGLYVIGVLAYWVGVCSFVAVRLWRAGTGQPNVTRKRMRLLGSASLAMSVAIVAVGIRAVGAEGAGWAVASRMSPVAAAIAFLFAFAPPRVLRERWRRPDEHALVAAERLLGTATTPAEVGEAVLPPASRVVGGSGGALYDGQWQLLAASGLESDEARHIGARLRDQGQSTQDREFLVVSLRSGWLVLRVGRYTPFFGVDEVNLLRGLGAVIDLALAQVEHVVAERRANAELEAILYGISHDLRSPLVTVLGYIEYLQKDFGAALGEEGNRYIERISASALYMEELIQDLLELSRIGRRSADADDVDLTRLAHSLAAEISSAHPAARIDVGALPTVAMPGVQARQLLANLLENAVRHAGRPDVRVLVSGEDREDGSAYMSIADNGQGVPSAYRDRVFGIFERLDPEDSGGTGIGLAICRKIVDQLGGRIWFEDAAVGADARVLFPPQAVRAPAEAELVR